MFSSRSISTLCVTALPAFVLFKSVIALPLDPEWDALLSKVAEYNHAKGLQARAPCGDNCQSSSILPQWTTTTTATAWVPAPTSHRSSTRTCTPNFQGAAVKVSPANKDSSWCIPAAPGQLPRPNAKLESLVGSGTTFHIEQTGRAEMDFIIKWVGFVVLHFIILSAEICSVICFVSFFLAMTDLVVSGTTALFLLPLEIISVCVILVLQHSK